MCEETGCQNQAELNVGSTQQTFVHALTHFVFLIFPLSSLIKYLRFCNAKKAIMEIIYRKLEELKKLENNPLARASLSVTSTGLASLSCSA